MNAVEAGEITFSYKGQSAPALDNVSFMLERGQIAAITGPSGSGKSTLGYCLCGVIPNLIKGNFRGRVSLRGRPGIVFQDPDSQILFPTVEDELAFGPENLCLSRQEIGDKIDKTLALLGLTDLRLANPSQLSGGEKQLVAIGGVLTLSPDIYVLDECLSQLDMSARFIIKDALLMLKKQGKTLIMIEHDQNNMDIADQIWFLNRGRLERLPAAKKVAGDV